MSVLNKVEHLDVTGLRCPMPVLKAARLCRELAAGTELVVRATDPMAELDFQHFCHEKGHEFLGVERSGEELTIRLRVQV